MTTTTTTPTYTDAVNHVEAARNILRDMRNTTNTVLPGGADVYTAIDGLLRNADRLLDNMVAEALSRTRLAVKRDQHGNASATEGCSRCDCGAKYWEFDHCVSCGTAHDARHDA